MPAWLATILRWIGPELIKIIGSAVRKWLANLSIKKQEQEGKKAADEFKKEPTKSNADNLIDKL